MKHSMTKSRKRTFCDKSNFRKRVINERCAGGIYRSVVGVEFAVILP